MKYLPGNCELDGDIFSLSLNNKLLNEIIKEEKNIHSQHDKLEYWIYDLIESQNLVWEDRYTILIQAYIKYLQDGNIPKTFRLLETLTVNNSQEIETYYNKFIKEGYSGVLIRRYGSVEKDRKIAQYRPGLNNSLIKYVR